MLANEERIIHSIIITPLDCAFHDIRRRSITAYDKSLLSRNSTRIPQTRPDQSAEIAAGKVPGIWFGGFRTDFEVCVRFLSRSEILERTTILARIDQTRLADRREFALLAELCDTGVRSRNPLARIIALGECGLYGILHARKVNVSSAAPSYRGAQLSGENRNIVAVAP